MSPRNSMFAGFLMFITLLLPISAMAENRNEMNELKRLQEWLNVLNQELKAELDQVLVLQQAQRMNTQIPMELQNNSPNIVLFIDVEASKRRAADQDAEIQARLASLLERTRSIDAKKLPILERIYELANQPPMEPAVGQPAPTAAPLN